MTIEEIKELLRIFNESGVAEFELQRGDNRLRLRRAGLSQEYVVGTPFAAPPAVAAAGYPLGAAPISTSTPEATATATPRVPEADSGHILVKSPIVGTYYDAPAPGAQSFVKVGDAVEPGHVLCIIESMKLMNEIECEVTGVVAAKLVENGRPVEYGEALFAIRPR
jgi:acetyl-CoA carboxylase biotin carboxyl carrier protein